MSRCSCDDFADGECAVHARENQLQDELIALRALAREMAEALRDASGELACANEPTGSHWCAHCDEYIDRNSLNRECIATLLSRAAGLLGAEGGGT